MKYINLFDTQAEYDAAEKYYPNTSYIEATDEVVYQENEPEPYSDIIVAKFTTTSANQNVKITNNQALFSDISIEGQSQTIGTGALNHTFASAGEHIVEYRALDTTLIPDSVFTNCNGLTSITIPDSVTTIGGGAFSNCTGLTNITIPDSVTSIGNNAFNGCGNLTSVTIPDTVTTIGTGAFYNCTDLTNITIPDSVTSIGDYAFSNCTGLTSITIPDSVTTIGGGAFNHCYRLTSITIPNSVISIGGSAFSSCFGLTSIVVESRNTKYDSRDNCNAIIETETNTLIAGCKNTIIPNSATTIGWSAFSGCTGLTSITIPDSVTSIGDYAFSNCTGLTSITIPDSVTTIGGSAFSNCTGLTSITSLAITPPAIQRSTFDGVPYDCPIYVPDGSEFEYMDAEGWSDRSNWIQPMPDE